MTYETTTKNVLKWGKKCVEQIEQNLSRLREKNNPGPKTICIGYMEDIKTDAPEVMKKEPMNIGHKGKQ